MKRLVLAGLTAFLLGTALLSSPAEARCWWNGFSWQCWHPHPLGWRAHPAAWGWRGHPAAWRWRGHPAAWHWRAHHPAWAWRGHPTGWAYGRGGRNVWWR
ncbi:MAG: hypothetical protein J2P48_10225 [Alphaproteobacteria bacterium]|nr:hypothetical protein [Alphaproteobacteria bacterium]